MAISFDVEDKDLTPRERLQKAEEQRLRGMAFDIGLDVRQEAVELAGR